MTSQIDITKPVFGTPTTQSVRDNFTTAANEISVLQQQTTGSPFLSLQGGRMAGPMYLYNDPTDAMMPATKGYVDAGGGGGGGGIPEAPAVAGLTFGRSEGAWVEVLALAGGTMLGPIELAADPADAMQPATKQYVDALKPTILPDAPNDAFFYGRHANAWAQVLALTGGVLSGSLGVNVTPPANISTTSRHVLANDFTVASGDLAFNAYLDNGSTPAWRYLAASAAAAVTVAGNNLWLAAAPSGAAGAAITFGLPVQIDPKGNLLLSNAAVVPTDCIYPTISAIDHAIGTAGGHLNFNTYVGTGGWKYLANGYGASMYQDNSNGRLLMNLAPSGSAGGNVTMNAAFIWDQSGNFSAPGSVGAGGNVNAAQNVNATGNVVANNYVQAGTFVLGYQAVYAVQANYGLYQQGSGRIFGIWPSWYWNFDTGSGNYQWFSPSGCTWYMRADNFDYNSVSNVGGYGAYANLCDDRAKTNVEPSDVGLDEVRQLQPIKFERIRRPRVISDELPLPEPKHKFRRFDDSDTEIGFSAQQVAPIIPLAVSKAGMELPDGTGGIDTDDPSLAISLDPIVAALVNAVKTLDARLASLEGHRA